MSKYQELIASKLTNFEKMECFIRRELDISPLQKTYKKEFLCIY